MYVGMKIWTYWSSVVQDSERWTSVLWLLVIGRALEVVMKLC